MDIDPKNHSLSLLYPLSLISYYKTLNLTYGESGSCIFYWNMHFFSFFLSVPGTTVCKFFLVYAIICSLQIKFVFRKKKKQLNNQISFPLKQCFSVSATAESNVKNRKKNPHWQVTKETDTWLKQANHGVRIWTSWRGAAVCVLWCLHVYYTEHGPRGKYADPYCPSAPGTP